jgi:hypothetical protein
MDLMISTVDIACQYQFAGSPPPLWAKVGKSANSDYFRADDFARNGA